MAIKIITDSASDISTEEAKQLGISVIPMEINFLDKVYLDGIDLTNDDFYDMLVSCKELPKTSQINPYRFTDYFDNIVKDGDKAIVILISSKLSGTYKNAKILEADYDNNIYVLDSLSVSIGERLLILYAQELISSGYSFTEIIKLLEEKKKNLKLIAKLDTLKYLRKGGRISSIVAFAGEALNIKPIIGVINGEVKMIGKGRGVQNANKQITKLIEENGGIDENLPFGTIYSGKDNSLLKKYIEENKRNFIKIDDVPMHQLGCTVGTHIGPNGIGIAFFKK